MSICTRRKFINFSGSGLLLVSMPGCVLGSLPAGKRSIPFYRHQTEILAEGINAKALDRLADLFYDMLAGGLDPGAQLAVFKDGKPVIHLGGGVMDPGGGAVTERTLFQIRSITKALTATVMLMLHDKGHFTFDDPIFHHWPGFEKNGKGGVTIGQLMSHRAGLTERAGLRMVDYQNRAAIVRAMENLSPGGGANVAWADPDQRLSVAFLCNAMLPQNTAWGQRYRQIGNAVYACFS